jgi:predicted lipid-binding transport protein (Tim44 family)
MLAKIVAGYFLGGLAGGALLGLLMPLSQTRIGAALLGFIVAVLVVYLLVLSADGQPDILVTLLTAALLGPASGLLIRHVNKQLDGL